MKGLLLGAAATLLLLAPGAERAAAQGVDWRYPAVEGFGPVVPIPDVSARRETGEGYKVIFNVTEGHPGDGRVSNELGLVARFVNLLAQSGMDPAASEIEAILHVGATSAVLTDEAYRALYGEANPNAELIRRLEENGVEVMVCGQALAGAGFPLGAVMEPVKVMTSAMTTLADRQLQGYALMP